MDASQIVLTAEGRQKLVEELAWREGDYAKEIVEDIKEARAFGDLSENSEYDAAKDKQAQNAARIAEIQAILANAQIAASTGDLTGAKSPSSCAWARREASTVMSTSAGLLLPSFLMRSSSSSSLPSIRFTLMPVLCVNPA